MMLLTWLWKIAKWLLLVTIVCVLLVILINLNDRKASPAAIELAMPFENVVTDQDNAYLYMLGFDAEKTAEPIELGRERLDKYNRANKLDPGQQADLIEPSFESRIKIDKFCDPFSQKCLEEMRGTDREKFRSVLTSHQYLLDRYSKLIQFKLFEEQAEPGLEIPPVWTASTQVHSLYLAAIAAEYIQGKREQPLSSLEADIRFNRLVLEQARSLLSKMVATAKLHKDYRLLGELIIDMSVEDLNRYNGLIESALIFSESSRDMTQVLHYESGFMRKAGENVDAMITQMISSESRSDPLSTLLARLFYKRQDYDNETAKWMIEYIAASRLKPEEWALQRSKLEIRLESMSQQSFTWIYNPIGKMLASVANPSYIDYIDRVFDLYAMNRLVGAAWKIKLLNSDAIEANRKLPREWLNPYASNPFDWDEKTRELSFKPIGRIRADRKYSLSFQ